MALQSIPENTVAFDGYLYYNDGLPGWVLTSGSASLGAGYFTTAHHRRTSWMLFTGIDIPQGAIIDSASLTISSYGIRTKTVVNSTISAHDVDDATTPANIAEALAFYAARTTAEISWNNIASWPVAGVDYISVDFTAVIQEVVNRLGWVSGNDIMIFWGDYDDNSTPVVVTIREGRSATHGVGPAVRLNISYFGLEKELSDTFVIDDTPAGSFVMSFANVYSDNLVITDILARNLAGNLILLDSFVIDDDSAGLFAMSFSRNFADVLVIIDDLAVPVLLVLILSDTLDITDDLITQLFLDVQESIAQVLGDPQSNEIPWMLYIAIGADNTPVDKFRDRALYDERYRKAGDVRVVANTYFVRAVFGQDEPTLDDWTIYEIGIFDSEEGGKMGARWVLDTGEDKDNIDEIVIECAITILHGDILTYSDEFSESVGISDSLVVEIS